MTTKTKEGRQTGDNLKMLFLGMLTDVE